ncbi:MAG TPA: YkgJ family cysteine cluster protein [Bryobacteraceae bacterium]|jgi:Fe-S-cluster containining protein
MDQLHQIQADVRRRVQAIEAAHESWPCRKGCDDCCRHLASAPRLTEAEWGPIARAIDALPAETAELVRERIRDSVRLTRPVVCPLLDCDSGTCLVYEARPVACRAYGFYAERADVLGCSRIEARARESTDIVWGNHAALEDRRQQLGPDAELWVWLVAFEELKRTAPERADAPTGFG